MHNASDLLAVIMVFLSAFPLLCIVVGILHYTHFVLFISTNASEQSLLPLTIHYIHVGTRATNDVHLDLFLPVHLANVAIAEIAAVAGKSRFVACRFHNRVPVCAPR